MTDKLSAAVDDFSLVRVSPLVSLLQRLRLARPRSGLGLWAAVVLCALTWLPPLALSALQGKAIDGSVGLPYLLDISVAVRFLLAIPLLVIAERLVDDRVRGALKHLVRSGLVSGHGISTLERIVRRAQQLSGSSVIELVGVPLVVFGTVFFRIELTEPITSWKFVVGSEGEIRTPAGMWYILVSIPIFQFMFYRWIWRYLVWCWMLWRISRLDLRLVPTHPDHAAGLGIFGFAHTAFGIVAFALSSVVSAEYAEDFLVGAATLSQSGPVVFGFVVLMLVILMAPLFVFTDVLFRVQWKGLQDYGALADRYTLGFDRKWIKGEAPPGEALLGNADIQSLADMAASYGIVREIRFVPVDPRTVLLPILACIILPLLPASLAVVPVEEIVRQIVSRLL